MESMIAAEYLQWMTDHTVATKILEHGRKSFRKM